MIVYFDKKSKIIRKWGIVASILIIGLYGLFVWGKIIQKDIRTMQIIHPQIKTLTEMSNELPKLVQQEQDVNSKEDYLFVASSRGKYYYPLNCSRAKALSVKNMLYFKDKMSAEVAGYVAHSGC